MAFDFVFFSSIIGLTALMIIFHKKVGEYPEPLLDAVDKKRELRQIIIGYVIYMISLCYVIFGVYNNGLYYPGIPIGSFKITYHLILVFLLPIIIEFAINKRRPKDMGITKNWHRIPGIVCIVFGILWGSVPAFFSAADPITPGEMIYYFVTPALSEEFFYRGFIQQKLERITTQNKAWLIAGLMFGALHIPTDFFGPIWIGNGEDIFMSSVALINQIKREI